MKVKFLLFCFLMLAYYGVHAQVSGLVFRDFNANGTRDSAAVVVEPRAAGITVTAYNANGVAIASTTSSLNGTYAFSAAQIPAGTPVRIEFTGIPSYAYSGPSGGTSVQFVTAGASAVNINFAYNFPDDYCQANPLVISTRNSVGPATGTKSALEGVYYDKPSFTTPGIEIGFSTNAAVGTTYGLAYARRTKTLFASAVIRNYFGTGPGGFDAIYPFAFNDPNDSASPAPTLTLGTTIDLSTLGVSMGTDPRTGPITGTNPYTDNATLYQKVGKIGIGDIDVDAEGDTLYVVNMNDGAPTLAILNVATPSSPTLLADVAMPNPGCVNGVFRPWAIKVYKGKAYIGGVCDASTGTASNLVAYVYRYDGGTSFTQVATMPLNYTRGKSTFRADGTFTSSNWLPWTNTWAPQTLPLSPADITAQPQPILADIEFTDDGSMILGFADRFTYQTAHGQRQYGVTSGSTFFTSPGSGDIIKFCNVNGTLVLESATGSCMQNNTDNGSITAANKINPPTGIKEFFDDDYYNTGSSSTGQAGHSECALGALAVLPGSSQVLTSNYDPTTTIAPGGSSGPVNSSGIRTYNSTNGNYVKGWTTTIQTDAGSNRKGGNMGDIEIMCNPAPIEIGNRVWVDSNFNGIQDPNEPGIAGVVLELVDAAGNPVDGDINTAGVQATTVTTDANGNWLLTTVTGADITGKNFSVNILPKTNYKVRVATSGVGADWASGAQFGSGNLAGLQLTKSNAVGSGAPDIADNDASLANSPEIDVFIESIGANNHTFDMGFVSLGSIGNYVWKDINNDGLQNEPATEGFNGQTVYLIEVSSGNVIDSAITANHPISGNPGYYLFDSLISGNYKIKFPINIGALVLTVAGTGATVDGNSNANSVSGESEVISIDAFASGVAKDNLTVDAGYAAFGSLGNYVWRDLNANGLQDEAGSEGINGQKVYLLNGTNNAIIDSFITANNPSTNQAGFYIFDHLISGDYKVKFPTAIGSASLTLTGTGTTVDGNSNANTTTGESEIITIDAFGVGVAKDNMTVDAGYVGFGSIGNYVWKDGNNDGLLNEAPIDGYNGITVYLLNAANGNIIDSTVTANNLGGNPGYYVFDSLASGNYQIKFPTTIGSAVLTIAGSGVTVDSNSNANSISGLSESISIDAYGSGIDKDNMTVDAGYASFGSIGNFVWQDLNGNGLFDEPASAGINGQMVYLINANTNAILDSSITANSPLTNQPGYYIFDYLVSGDYKVQFPTAVAAMQLTTQGSGVTVDSNSNPNITTGHSETITIDAFGTGVARDNMTVDAGYVVLGSIGDYVWYDNNKNGLQDSIIAPVFGTNNGPELPVQGVIVELYTAANVLFGTDTTDANGKYLFNNIPLGNYYVQFSNTSFPVNYSVTTPNAGSNDSLDSDANPATLRTDTTGITAGEIDPRWDLGIYINDTLTITDSCNCHNIEYWTYETPEKLEYLDIKSTPGDVWVLVAQTGMKQIDTIFNPLLPLNTIIPEVASGHYQLRFAHQVGDGYTATVTNGTDTLSIANTCWGVNAADLNIPDTIDCAFPTLTTLVGSATYKDALGISAAAGTYQYYMIDDIGDTTFITQFDKSTIGNVDTSIEIHLIFTPSNPTFCAELYFSKPIHIKECTQYGSIGNYVWFDLNNNGVQDEDSTQGINGLTIYLMDSLGNVIDSTLTANDNFSKPGYYSFDSLISGKYQIQFPTTAFGAVLTKTVDQGTQLDLNSDADFNTGKSALIPIDVTLSGLDKNNPTIDAGYTPLGSIGNYVWFDKNRNGIQDSIQSPWTGAVLGPELPVPNVLVQLYTAQDVLYGSDTTDAAGHYSFDNIPIGYYYVKFVNTSLPANYRVTIQNASANDSLDSDVNALNFQTDTTFISANEIDYRWDLGIFKKDTLEIKDPCTCFDIEYKAGEIKQAYEVVELKAEPNDTWIIIAQSGMQQLDSVSGPNVPIPVGDTILETSPGVYDLPFLFPMGGSYSITVTNGYDTLSHSNVCYGTRSGDINLNDTLACNFPSVSTIVGNATRVDATGTYPAAGTFVYYFIGAANDTNYITQFSKAAFGFDTTITLHADFTPTDAALCPLHFSKEITIEACFGSLGNYVWVDSNANGLNDEVPAAGVPGVKVYLLDGASAVIDSTITDISGYYLFDSLANGDYAVKFPTTVGGSTELTSQTVSSQVDSNSDANPINGNSPFVTINTGGLALDRNNPTIDAGYTSYGSIGTYVWIDSNANGQFDENPVAGINGITLYLLDSNQMPIDSTVTANDGGGNPGFYMFPKLPSGTYFVQFPTNIGNGLTAQDSTSQTSGNSDPNTGTGISSAILIDGFGAGFNKDNTTIFAGYIPGAPLALDGIVLNVSAEADLNYIEWTLINPVDIVGFDVLKGTEMNAMMVLASVEANAENKYVLADKEVLGGVTYYSVKAYDASGKIYNSLIKMLYRSKSQELALYPNPAVNTLQIALRKKLNAVARITIVNQAGMVVKTILAPKGYSSYQINIRDIAAGTYIIKLSVDGELFSLPFVKQ